MPIKKKARLTPKQKFIKFLPLIVLIVGLAFLLFYIDKNLHSLPFSASTGKNSANTFKEIHSENILKPNVKSFNPDINLKSYDNQILDVLKAEQVVSLSSENILENRLDKMDQLFSERRYDQILDSINSLASVNSKITGDLIEKPVKFKNRLNIKLYTSEANEHEELVVVENGREYKFLTKDPTQIEPLKMYDISGYQFRDKLIITSLSKLSEPDIRAQAITGSLNIYSIAVEDLTTFPLASTVNSDEKIATYTRNIESFFAKESFNRVKFSGKSKLINYHYSDCEILGPNIVEMLKASGFYQSIKTGDFIQTHKNCTKSHGGVAFLGPVDIVGPSGSNITVYASMIPGGWQEASYHEISHNFGRMHSGSFSACVNPLEGKCTNLIQYGHPYDVLGNIIYGVSSAKKEKFGWLNASEYIELAKGDNKTYTINKTNNSTENVLKVVKLNGIKGTLFDQTDFASDQFVQYYVENWNNRIVINMYRPYYYKDKYGSTTFNPNDLVYLNDTTKTALEPGQSFIDNVNKVVVKYNFLDSDNANVTISYNNSSPPPTDTTPPTVSISSPSNGSTVNGNVNITANASDNVGINTLNILIDGSAVKSCQGSTSCSYSWDTRTASNSSHTIVANSSDAAGNFNSTTINVTVSNGSTPPPSNGEINPANGSNISLPVTFTWQNIPGAAYTVSLGTYKGAADLAYNYATTNSYTYQGNSSLKGKTIYLRIITYTRSITYKDYYFIVGDGSNPPPPPPTDTTPPTVSISSPANGSTISGNVNITVNATDNVAVTSIDMFVDGSKIKNCSNLTTCSYTWATTSASNGSHTIAADSYDSRSNRSSTSITVNVSNGSTPPPPPPSSEDINPASGSTISLPTTFEWKNTASSYAVMFGSYKGASNYGTVYLSTNKYTFSNFVPSGTTLYVRVISYNRPTSYKDYVYTVK